MYKQFTPEVRFIASNAPWTDERKQLQQEKKKAKSSYFRDSVFRYQTNNVKQELQAIYHPLLHALI